MIGGLTMHESERLYHGVLTDRDCAAMRWLAQNDVYFLATVCGRRGDMRRQWIYDRCREWDAARDGHLDLWAREHYKSTIITCWGTIQSILRDPEITVGIFSHTRPIAKSFLGQIQRELEDSDLLRDLFPDVLWQQPRREARSWSQDGGLIVRRKTNPKEATVEAWGLVDGQPTSRHYRLCVYDDVVTLASVTTPEQIAKTTQAWEMSLNLGSDGGAARYIGTRYHHADTYRTMIDRGSVIPRIHTATDDGTPTGRPVLLSAEALDEKRRDMGPYVYASQMLQDPLADAAMSFRREWVMYYTTQPDPAQMAVYVVVDPASSKRQDSDYTAMWVIGLGQDRNYYLLDGVRDRLNLTQRTDGLFRLVREWQPRAVGYERYGLQADVEHIRSEMDRQQYRFRLVELPAPGTGQAQLGKFDRIQRLVPLFEQGRFWLPVRIMYGDCEGRMHDLVQEFLDHEYLSYPVASHDDMLDCMARILDPGLGTTWPGVSGDRRNGARRRVGQPASTKREYAVL